jgi:uncharacterized membrane protein (UPF0127 family)
VRNLAATTLLLAFAGCSEPPAELPGCVDEEPSALGRECSGDGECGNWLVCVDSACDLPPAVSGEGGTSLTILDGDQPVADLRVELARGDLARERGLGNRPCIEEGWGMLIEFPQAGDPLIQTNTMRFDLDIAMVGPDRVIHTVHRDAPAGGKALYGAPNPIRWVLEVPAASIEMQPEMQLRF